MNRRWTPQAVGEMAALVILIVAGVQLARTWLRYRDQAASTKKAMVGVLAQPGIVLGSLDGAGLHGYLISPATDAQTRVVIFLLRPKTALRDLALWDRIAAGFGGNRNLQFRGFCESTACGLLAAVPRGVVVMRAGGARTLEGLMQADQRGGALLVGASLGRVIAVIRWRGRPDPRRIASEITASGRGLQ